MFRWEHCLQGQKPLLPLEYFVAETFINDPTEVYGILLCIVDVSHLGDGNHPTPRSFLGEILFRFSMFNATYSNIFSNPLCFTP